MSDTERLAAFLFRIMRDELPTGTVEEHVRVVEEVHMPGEAVIYEGEARPLGQYARALAKRLTHEEEGK